ncbi:sulfotransferase domain-containing protein [uncultured Roseobacter sp.]|uniref:sulfotransferase domain-containing protein n=1 Tax=uncultured Roseobacter sp. TaxID=114847 RepID=UPI00261ADED6|nr:sulfotransferase domain-containing protein [uncultured Roseobacter sp.]
MAQPDFLLIGAMKCGTSTLATQLGLQDGVFMTTPKEPNFFSDDDIYARGTDWYAALYAEAAPGDLKGEASTHYTKLPTYPDTVARMTALLAAPRLVYMIRNPITRAVSHYIHEWSEGRMSSDPVQAFESSEEITSYGCYGMQIAPFVEAYGAAHIHLTSLEQIKADPDAEFTRIAAFLGLPDTAAWVHDLPAQNISAERMRRLPLQGLLIDHPVAAALRRRLVPKSLRAWIRAKRTMTTRPEIPKDLQNRIETRFVEDRDRLAAIFPDHPALDLCYPFAPQ